MSAWPAVPIAVLLDRLFGEPPRFHPLVGFGVLASRMEAAMRCANESAAASRMKGFAAAALLLVPFVAAAAVLAAVPYLVADVLLLAFALGGRSLEEHARNVVHALNQGDVDAGRSALGRMVSRDTQELDGTAIARATIESVLENGNDAVYAALFWFGLLGAPGAVLYRLANTLDAMWGYRNERYLHFGRFAARLDDALNYIPARITALVYCLCGSIRSAYSCWRVQAPLWYSPNAGPVMASGAGSLCLQLGGGASYGGVWKDRPALGCGNDPLPQDILRALSLVRRGTWVWVALASALRWGLADG